MLFNKELLNEIDTSPMMWTTFLVSSLLIECCTLQIGHNMNPNVIRGPSQRFSRTRRVHWRWNTWVQSNWVKKNKLNFRSEQSEWKHLHGKDTYLVTESPVQQELLKEPLWNKSYTYHLHPVSGNPCSCRSHADMGGRSPHFWLLHRGVHKDGFYCKPALHTPE